MTDFASCLSVKTFLNMCGLKFQTELRTNAEFMSPSGNLNDVLTITLIIERVNCVFCLLKLKWAVALSVVYVERVIEVNLFVRHMY
jgi:metaxin